MPYCYGDFFSSDYSTVMCKSKWRNRMTDMTVKQRVLVDARLEPELKYRRVPIDQPAKRESTRGCPKDCPE